MGRWPERRPDAVDAKWLGVGGGRPISGATDLPAGYPPLRKFLHEHGVRHVLLTGYATDMCFCRTTAGYENLSRDFNVFLVGDATLATFPANDSPRYATNAHISFAALNHLITQVSWIRLTEKPSAAKEGQ